MSRSIAKSIVPFAAAALTAGLAPCQLLPNQALTVDRNTSRVYVIDDTGAILSSVLVPSLGSAPLDAAVTADGRVGLVTTFFSCGLEIFDLTTSPPTVTGTVGIPLNAEDIDMTCTTTGFALITDGGPSSNGVVSVDLTNALVTNAILLFGATAQAVDVTPDGALALVAGHTSNTIRVVLVDPTTGQLTDTEVDVPRGSPRGPLNVTISPNGRIALVANGTPINTIDVLSIAGTTVSLVGTIDLHQGSQQSIVFSPDGSKAYVYHASAGVVSKLAIDALDNVTDTGVRITGVGTAPNFFGVDQIAVTPTGSIYVRSTSAYRVISAATDAVIAGPTAIAGGTGGGVATLCRHNRPPNADAGQDQEVPCTSPGGASVTLNATASSDPDLDSLGFLWSVPSGIVLDDASSATPTGVFPLGITTATVTVTDGKGGISTDSVVVSVFDATPPDVVCTADRSSLWPPNHNMVPVTIVVAASDMCATPGQLLLTRVQVASSEPDDADGIGDGSTVGDTVGVDGYSSPVEVALAFTYDVASQQYIGTIPLRAERDGTGSGRSYAITATVQDPSGNQSSSGCVVVVPHDRRR